MTPAQEYAAIQSRMREIVADKSFGEVVEAMASPEFQRHWKRLEAIKNQTGGHVPKENEEK